VTNMNDIFISHAHEPTDREFAASLRQLLMSTGYDVSRDYPKDTVHPRDYWESQIRAAIEDCSVVIVLLSKEYLTSEYCLREMRHAISTQRFLPIALPNFEWAAWAEPIWLECNAVVSADLGSDDFSWWLSDELRDTYGLSSRKGDQYDEKRRSESGRFRDARVHWVSKSPLQLMKTARHHPELNPGTHDIIKHILFPAQTGQELERPGERSDAGNVQDLGAACVMTDKALNDDLRLWRPTRHYGRLLTEGRNRPAPSIGSPTLFWHLAIWRKRIEGDGGYREALTKKNVQKYVDHNRNFFHEISHFLRHLQDRGLVSSSTPRDITLDEIPISASRNDDADPFERFEAFLPQGMNFELWWLDGANRDNPNRRLDASKSTKEEIDGATRVLVQFQSFQDHVTCTFYMDIAQQFDGHQILDADELSTCGARKRKIGEILHSIRKASLGHVKSGAIDAPERISSDDPAIPSALRLGSDELQPQ